MKRIKAEIDGRTSRNVAWPTPEENAGLVFRIIALAGEMMKLDGSDGVLPNHFVLEQVSAKIGVGTLSDTTVADAPTFFDDPRWQGRSPLYAVSAVCPCYHPGDMLGFGHHWSLLRISVYWTVGSRKKLRHFENGLRAQTSSQTFQFGTGLGLLTPGTIAFKSMLHGERPTVDWSGGASSHRHEAQQWCEAQPYADVVTLRGMEVRTGFKPSPLREGSKGRKAPVIKVHKIL